MIPATDKQIRYIEDLAESLGAENGRIWLLDRLGASLSARPSKYLGRHAASELINALKSATSLEELEE